MPSRRIVQPSDQKPASPFDHRPGSCSSFSARSPLSRRGGVSGAQPIWLHFACHEAGELSFTDGEREKEGGRESEWVKPRGSTWKELGGGSQRSRFQSYQPCWLRPEGSDLWTALQESHGATRAFCECIMYAKSGTQQREVPARRKKSHNSLSSLDLGLCGERFPVPPREAALPHVNCNMRDRCICIESSRFWIFFSSENNKGLRRHQ